MLAKLARVVREKTLPHRNRYLKKHLMSPVATLPNQPPKLPNQPEVIR